MTKFSTLLCGIAGAAALAALPTAASAQDGRSARVLQLPENITLFGDTLPPVVKATAIVNGEIITQTDIDQRVALTLVGSPPPSAEEYRLLQQQVLRNLIDETLQIQAAAQEEIDIPAADIARALERVVQNAQMETVDQLEAFLEENGSSLRSITRQIRAELAWQRLQQVKIADFISVGEEEIQAIIDKMESARGTTEYRVGEIFLASTPANEAQVRQTALQILDALRQGGSFAAYARQFSEASTAAVGGDLGWVRPEQLPEALGSALRNMAPGAVSVPIKIPGGYSILALQDQRQILMADPRNAVLSLKQVTVPIPEGSTTQAANALVDRFAAAAAEVQGCGGAERLAADFGGTVLSADGTLVRDLPPALQPMMMEMQIGQATRPFGDLNEAVRALVLCGRDEQQVSMPSRDQIEQQKREERITLRARRYLRDLRRDAIIDYR
ncbi:peptidylprolyl isomerase [Sphingomicrobium astaxanthinifaciens]|uniref:peptidylprolyl isomerase n=1 Tax=Sphingomicrobium astaxanthinifaciens TaxID=1227949 RepID=UPI001FCC57EB|nr:peptidylprolyl isomerase [Sphingomicrobium astaxanthinifaciens]MCJ7422215.1 peptidylprolyl isomerase [Sphingomicrobium astaxanthinifaciens]